MSDRSIRLKSSFVPRLLNVLSNILEKLLILISSLLFFGTKKKLLIPSKLQLITEMSYTFVAKMINEAINDGWAYEKNNSNPYTFDVSHIETDYQLNLK